MAVEGELAAVICIEDPLREEAADVVKNLRRAGFDQVVMMTGDSERTCLLYTSRELSDTVHTTMALSLISGLLLTAIGVVLSRYFLIWMGTPDEVLPLATEYLRIYFLGMTGMMVYNFGGAILRARCV